MTDERDWALACVLGARDRTDNEKVRQGLLDAHRMLVDGQPTDEPTEADPECPESATADGCHCKCERGTCCWCGTDRPPTVTPFPLNDEPTRADECIAALRSWAEEERYTTTLAGHALTVLAELDRLRALVGGRSAAPTREQVQEAIHDAYVAEVKPPSFLTVASMWQLTDAVVALLSRSAAEPPATIDGRDHTTDAQTVIAAYLRTADLPAMRGTWAAMCEDVAAEILSELRAAGLVYDGVAAEPNEEAGDGR